VKVIKKNDKYCFTRKQGEANKHILLSVGLLPLHHIFYTTFVLGCFESYMQAVLTSSLRLPLQLHLINSITKTLNHMNL